MLTSLFGVKALGSFFKAMEGIASEVGGLFQLGNGHLQCDRLSAHTPAVAITDEELLIDIYRLL